MGLGLYVGPALAAGGFLGLLLLFGDVSKAAAILFTTPYQIAASYAFVALPLVILLGAFAMHLGMTTAGYRAAAYWLGKLPGGLAIATVWGSAAYGAVCASSVASCAVFSKISYPEMKAAGYHPTLSLGSVLGGGIIGMLIPPSGLAIIYGILTETSIAKLFIGGVGPGILLSAVFSIAVILMVMHNPKLTSPTKIQISWKLRITSLISIWGIVVLATIMLGGVYIGIFTVIEGAAVGAFFAFMVYVISNRRSWSILRDILLDAGHTTGAVFTIILGATIFSRMLALTGIPTRAVEFIDTLGLSSMSVLWIILFIYIFLGCFLDSISMLSMTMGVVHPMMIGFGFDPIWIGLVIIFACEVGLLTPPMGLNVYTVKVAVGNEVSLEQVFKAAFPFAICTVVCLVILVYVPQIISWLPSMMFTAPGG
jgi:tripartite ATP-independent transporter DctM subunit